MIPLVDSVERNVKMDAKKLLIIIGIIVSISGCNVLRSNTNRPVPEVRAQLSINSLHAKQIQEQGLLGVQDGDELSLVYTINAYDEKGNLLSVNNGFWGTRTISQDALILGEEFDEINVHIPREGKVIVALSLIEVDDPRGERKIAKIKPRTNSERYPKVFNTSTFNDDLNLPPLELISRSLKMAGYKNFITKQLNLSLNDELGSTKQIFDTADIQKLSSSNAGKETYEIDGRRVNENYLYILKYDLDLSTASGAAKR